MLSYKKKKSYLVKLVCWSLFEAEPLDRVTRVTVHFHVEKNENLVRQFNNDQYFNYWPSITE